VVLGDIELKSAAVRRAAVWILDSNTQITAFGS